MKYLSQSQFSNRRVIVDECVSLKSELFLRFSRERADRAPINYVFLAKEHRAVPDDLILTRARPIRPGGLQRGVEANVEGKVRSRDLALGGQIDGLYRSAP